MKLRMEKKASQDEIVLSPDGIYELGGFGVLIEFHPNKRHIVKHGLTGKMMDKRNAYPCGQHKENYFYLKIGEKINVEDLEYLTPSRFDELEEEMK